MRQNLKLRFTWCALAALPTIAVIAIRSFGWLQPFEWTALDIYFQLRPQETVDSRIVIVGFEEKDIQALKADSLSDQLLAQLITKIRQQKPRVIGLDFYRDVPVKEGYSQLVKVFKTTPNLIGVEKIISDKYYPKIAPPPVLKQLNQVATVDTLEDGDGVVRRALLFPTKTSQNLGLATALIYLKKQKITATSNKSGSLQLQETVFNPLQENDGGYVRTDIVGYQILLNFRNPSQNFSRVSVTDVLSGRLSSSLFHDHIVLIGATAPSFNDRFSTPYSRNLGTTPIEVPGVEIQAQIASQIISSTLDNRPIIKTLNELLELLWIAIWAVILISLAKKWQRISNTKTFASDFLVKLTFTSLVAAIIVAGFSYLAFILGWWIPVIPPFLVLAISSFLVTNYTYICNLSEQGQILEKQVAERTKELKLSHQQLKQSMQKLKDSQQQILIQSKLASLGSLMKSISHEINNPLNFVVMLTKADIDLTKKLQLEIEQEYQYLPIEIIENLSQILSDLLENTTDIRNQVERIKLIVQIMASSTEHKNSTPEIIEINNLLSVIVRIVSYSLQYKYNDFNVSVKTNYDNSIKQVNLVSLDISRALINIIDNACQAAYEKALVQPNLKPEVLIKTKNLIENDSIEISIQDNGAGIPQNILDKIFDPFFTTKPPNKGTGIGLYFAHNLIIERNGGQIKVDSQLGAYTIFTIILPKNISHN